MLDFSQGFVIIGGFRGKYFPELNGLRREDILTEIQSLVSYCEGTCYKEIFTLSGLRFLGSTQAVDTRELELLLRDPDLNPVYPYVMRRFYRTGFWRDIGARAIQGPGGSKEVNMDSLLRDLELDYIVKAGEAIRVAPSKLREDGRSIYNVGMLNPLYFV